MKVKFKKFHPDARIPEQADQLSGGWDVFCTEVIKEADDFYICKLGFGLQPPPNYKVTLVPRSSLTKTHWIQQNSPGLGDQNFTGEYQYRFRALPKSVRIDNESAWGVYFIYPDFPFKVGDRIGQIYLEEVIPIEFVEVDELDETVRGDGGFGSTGR